MSALHLARIPFLNPDGTVSRPWLLHLLRENELLIETRAISSSAQQMTSLSLALGEGGGGDGDYEFSMIPGPMGMRGRDGANGMPGMDGEDAESIIMLPPSNTGPGTYTDLNVTGNTVLGDAATDTLNVGAGGLVKDAAGNVGIGETPSAWGAGYNALEMVGGAMLAPTSALYQMPHNLYNDGTDWRYKTSAAATLIEQTGLIIKFYTAPVGVADDVATLTMRMFIQETSVRVDVPLSTLATLNTGGYTVGTLPAGTVGMRAYVTDALAPAYGAPVVGGGTIIVPVFRNATIWICT